MDCFCDYDGPSFYVRETPKARKPHRCFECGYQIAPGETYESARGMWDGTFDVFKTCNRCIALRDCVTAHIPCFCLMHGNLLEDVRESVLNLPAEAYGTGLLFEIGRLAVAIKRAPRQLQGA